MNFMIVDDSPFDREMVRITLKEIDETCSVSETDSIETMFKRLKKPCDLLLLDISLDSADSTNSAGLDALRSLIGEFPDVPIAFITGHFADKVREFVSYLGSSKQLIDYIDKSQLNEERLRLTIEKAVVYRNDFRETKSADDRARYYLEAFTGEDWRQRVGAESWIPDLGGCCNINGMLLWVTIEEILRNLAPKMTQEKANISTLITALKVRGMLSHDLSEMIFRCKFARDNFAHHKQDIKKSDALLMCKCLDALS